MPLKTLRRRYLVRRFQLKFAGFVLFIMIAIGVLCFLVYGYGMSILVEKLANVYPQHRLVAILQEVNLRLVMGFLLTIPVILITSVLISHRIAGPLVRIEKNLREIGTGNLSVSVKLRKSDELQDLAATINSMTFSIKEKMQLPKESVMRQADTLKLIKEECTKVEPQPATLISLIRELESEIHTLQDSFSKFVLT
ncbi:MAG: HAMP domain-containing protein [Candidatus Omnitrophota bacterium]